MNFYTKERLKILFHFIWITILLFLVFLPLYILLWLHGVNKT